MLVLYRSKRLRSSVSTLLVAVMVLAMVPFAAIAATPATPVLTDPGTTNLATVSGTASNGLNGVHSLEVTGTVATKSMSRGATLSPTAVLSELATFVVNPALVPTLAIVYTDPFGIIHTREITGLTRASTVASVTAAINAQVATVTAGFDTVGRVTITANQYGATTISGRGSVWDSFFEPIWAIHRPGVPYGGNFRVINSFTPVDGAIFPVGDAVLGHLGADRSFATTVHPVSGAFTAVRLAPGFDIVLATAGPQMGLKHGTARVTVGSGVRAPVAPGAISVSPREVQAGEPTTFTVTIASNASTETTAVVDRVRMTLPAGFSFVATPTVLATAGAAPASITVGPMGVVDIWNFRLGQASETTRPLVVTLGGVNAASVAATGYAFGIKYRNIGSAEFLPVDPAQPIRVQPRNEVASIDLSATGNRAGGTSELGARLFDRFGNEINSTVRGEWPRVVSFVATGPVPARPSTLSSPSILAPDHPYYGYRNMVRLSATEGTTTITATTSATVLPGSATVTATVTINTAGVGAPHRLVVRSDTNPALAGERVWFRIGLVDANGRATSFLDGPATRDYTLSFGQGGRETTTRSIDQLFSQTLFQMTSPVAATWDMLAVDTVRGAVFESGILRQVWGAVPAPPGVYSGLRVTASPVVRDRYIAGISAPFNRNTGNFGYSQADGVSAVQFTVTTVDVNGAPVATPGRTIDAADLSPTLPGVISPVSAVTNASGVATFTVTSTTPTGRHAFNQWRFTDRISPLLHADGWANHFTAIVRAVTVDRSVARADGVNAITVTAHMTDPFEFQPVAGARALFSEVTSPPLGVSLSRTSAVSDAAGRASITVTSTAWGPANIRARDIVGATESSVMVHFTQFIATPVDAMITAQQSARGPLADVRWRIQDLQGRVVTVTAIASPPAPVFAGDRVTDGLIRGHDGSVLNTVILADSRLVAGDKVTAVFSGMFTNIGRFGHTPEHFVGTVDIGVVNDAGAQVNWIDAANGQFLSRFTVTGGDFRRANFHLPGSSNEVTVYHTNVRGEWVKAGYGIVDSGGRLSPQVTRGWDSPASGVERNLAIPLRLGASLPSGTYDVRVDGIVFPDLLRIAGGNVLRVGGANRYLTAVELSAANFARADNVVIATGENFPDALTASALASALRAPVLLSRPGSVSVEVLAEIERLGARKVYIIGGTGAVGTPVAVALQNEGLVVERISGADRYATAAAVANKVLSVIGPAWNGRVFIASGENFPDALSAAPLAGAQGMPILLTRRDALPAATAGFLAAENVVRSYVVGGTGVIGTWIQDAAPRAIRVAGADRYATAVAVAELAKTFGMSYGYLGIASGSNFPDALAGGVVVARNNGVLLLTHPNALSPATADAITANRPSRVEVFGGTGAVSTDVIEALERRLF